MQNGNGALPSGCSRFCVFGGLAKRRMDQKQIRTPTKQDTVGGGDAFPKKRKPNPIKRNRERKRLSRVDPGRLSFPALTLQVIGTGGWRDETRLRNGQIPKPRKMPIWRCESSRPRARCVSAPLYGVSITQIHGHHANRTLESVLRTLVIVPECDSNGVWAC